MNENTQIIPEETIVLNLQFGAFQKQSNLRWRFRV